LASAAGGAAACCEFLSSHPASASIAPMTVATTIGDRFMPSSFSRFDPHFATQCGVIVAVDELP